ncbi:MAG: hypothetical protein ACLRPW_04675 [Intestinibacter sp.]
MDQIVLTAQDLQVMYIKHAEGKTIPISSYKQHGTLFQEAITTGDLLYLQLYWNRNQVMLIYVEIIHYTCKWNCFKNDKLNYQHYGYLNALLGQEDFN